MEWTWRRGPLIHCVMGVALGPPLVLLRAARGAARLTSRLTSIAVSIVLGSAGCQSEGAIETTRTARHAESAFEPCGGDPTGSWKIELLVNEDELECHSRRVEFEPNRSYLYFAPRREGPVPPSFVRSHGADEPHGNVDIQVKDGCLDAGTCEAYLTSEGQEPVCAESEARGCSCKYTLRPHRDLVDAYWVVDGDVLKTTNSGGETLQEGKFCVSEPYLVLRYGDTADGAWTFVAERREEETGEE